MPWISSVKAFVLSYLRMACEPRINILELELAFHNSSAANVRCKQELVLLHAQAAAAVCRYTSRIFAYIVRQEGKHPGTTKQNGRPAVGPIPYGIGLVNPDPRRPRLAPRKTI